MGTSVINSPLFPSSLVNSESLILWTISHTADIAKKIGCKCECEPICMHLFIDEGGRGGQGESTNGSWGCTNIYTAV